MPREVWPLARFIADSWWQRGELSLWRPYQLSGAPLIGHPVAPVLYPLYWLILVLPLPLALNLNVVFHVWWCGAGMYWYLKRQAKLRSEAAFAGALLLAHSPKWIAHYSGGHWPMMAAIAWFPWAILAFSSYWATGQARWAVLQGVALAAQAINHGAYLLITCVGLGFATLVYLVPNIVDGVKRAVFGWGIALSVLVGLAAGQLWPLLELLPLTTRTALTPAEAAFGSLPAPLLLALFFPPEVKFPEWFVVPGVGTLTLALLGWVGGWSRLERGWVLAGLAGLVVSLGASTPLFWLLYRLPGFAWFRNPSRWSIFMLTALAVLAAFGIEKWSSAMLLPRRRMLLTLSWLVFFYVVTAGLKIAWPALLPFDILPSAVAAVALVVVSLLPSSKWRWVAFVVIATANVWWTAAGLIQPEPESTLTEEDRVAQFLKASAAEGERSFAPYGGISASTLVVFNLRAVEGYDPAPLAAYAELVRRAAGCEFAGYAVGVPPMLASPAATTACPQFRPAPGLLALLNVRYIILPMSADLPGASLVLTDANRWVYDIGPGNGQAFEVTRWEVAPSDRCVDRLIDIDPSVTALVDSPLPPPTTAPSGLVVLSHEASANRETFIVRTDGPGLLIRSESWAPGWSAMIDNDAATVLRVDCALQGVWLEAGEHRVTFAYQPAGFVIGRWISAVTMIGLVASAMYFCVIRMRDFGKRIE